MVEILSSDLLRAIVSYWEESHLEFYQTFTMTPFRKNSQRSQQVDYFRRKWPHRKYLPGLQMRLRLEVRNYRLVYREVDEARSDYKPYLPIALRHGCFPVNLLHIFRTPFYKKLYSYDKSFFKKTKYFCLSV